MEWIMVGVLIGILLMVVIFVIWVILNFNIEENDIGINSLDMNSLEDLYYDLNDIMIYINKSDSIFIDDLINFEDNILIKYDNLPFSIKNNTIVESMISTILHMSNMKKQELEKSE